MSQRVLQFSVVGMAIILFLLLYFGGRTKPLNRSQIDKTRALRAESTVDIASLLQSAKENLTSEQLSPLLQLESELENQKSDTNRVEILKKISSEWNKLTNFALGGYYAEQVAEILGTDEAWSMAGTTYILGGRSTPDESTRTYCINRAITALENAISINPTETAHKINLGLAKTESAQPMQGIMLLRGLLEKEPENTAVLMALGQLSIRSGQYDKAIERYQQVIKLEQKHLQAHLGLAQVFQQTDRISEAREMYQKCIQLSDDERFKSGIQDILNQIK